MTIDLVEFRKYLQINKHALDDELIQQPSLFYEVSEAYVQAAAERDAAKEALACADAKIDGIIRDRESDNKITETMVKNEVTLHPSHIKAFSSWLDAKLLADQLQAMKEAFQQRSYMLKDLASLYVSNYFENQSVRADAQSDAAIYRKRRERLGDARAKRGQE